MRRFYVLQDRNEHYLDFTKERTVNTVKQMEASTQFSTLERLHYTLQKFELIPSDYHICQYDSNLLGEHPADVMLYERKNELEEIFADIYNEKLISYEHLRRVLVITHEDDDVIRGYFFDDGTRKEVLFTKDEFNLWRMFVPISV